MDAYKCVGCLKPYQTRVVDRVGRRFAVALPAAGTVVCDECIDLMTEALAEDRARWDAIEAEALPIARRRLLDTLKRRAVA